MVILPNMKPLLLLAGAAFCVSMACNRMNDAAQPATMLPYVPLTDAALYAEATASTGFSWYQREDATPKQSGRGTGHSPFRRVRYNAIAAAALTDSGRLPKGQVFPEGSLIVKELYSDATINSPWELIAVMKKSSQDFNAVQGWVWGEYLPQISSDYIRLDS
jgi:hypothetical protein